jgi:hypothetical protein
MKHQSTISAITRRGTDEYVMGWALTWGWQRRSNLQNPISVLNSVQLGCIEPVTMLSFYSKTPVLVNSRHISPFAVAIAVIVVRFYLVQALVKQAIAVKRDGYLLKNHGLYLLRIREPNQTQYKSDRNGVMPVIIPVMTDTRLWSCQCKLKKRSNVKLTTLIVMLNIRRFDSCSVWLTLAVIEHLQQLFMKLIARSNR